MALKELEARYATTHARDYKLADGGGLYLFVRANGSKLWRMKYWFEGKERLLALPVEGEPGLKALRAKRGAGPIVVASKLKG